MSYSKKSENSKYIMFNVNEGHSMTFIKILCLPLFGLHEVVTEISPVLLGVFKHLKVFDLLNVELLRFHRGAFLIKINNWFCAVCPFFSEEANKMEILAAQFA